METADPIMQHQSERRWFIDIVTARFGERLAEARWIFGSQLQFTLFEPSDAAELTDLALSEGVAEWVTVLVAKPRDLTDWEDLRHELIRLQQVEPRVLLQYPMTSPGYRHPPVRIGLAAYAETTARVLHERFGHFVAVTVGSLSYPGRERSARTGRVVVPVHYSYETPAELADPVSVRSGHTVRAALLLANHTSAPITVNTNGNLTALIVDPAGRVVGTYAGNQNLPLVRFTAEPGGTVRIPLLIGTASLDPALGYAVPPGTWGVIAPLWNRDGVRVCTPPVLVTITE